MGHELVGLQKSVLPEKSVAMTRTPLAWASSRCIPKPSEPWGEV